MSTPGDLRTTPAATGARPERRGKDELRRSLALVGAAGAAGMLLARLIDWRSHAHPRW